MNGLQNTYYLLRHGTSVANEEGLIVSSPEVGTRRYGLADIGRQQVRQSVENAADRLGDVHAVYSSDFLRTKQTAEIACEILGVPLTTTPTLRERFFGELDLQSNDHYANVWRYDAEDPSHERWGVESVVSVAARMESAISELEDKFRGKTLLVVSHGDPLQILLTQRSGQSLTKHREIEPIQTAEIRELGGLGGRNHESNESHE